MSTVYQIIAHEFFMAFYGVFAWYAILYGIAKKESMTARKKIKFTAWFKLYNTDILVAVIVAFAIVSFDDELIAAYNQFAEKDITFSRYMYLLPGVATDMIYKLIQKYKAK